MSDVTTSKLPRNASEDLKAQADYAERKEQEGGELELMVADAFVRGIRDIGYKSTGTALNELIDNGIQAEGRILHVITNFEKQAGKKGKPTYRPTSLIVIDNGHGMPPKMLRHAIRWGGTHRENDRNGFGRFGYGLPSASVSQGRRFALYSSMASADWHAASLDIDLVGDGTYLRERRIIIPNETRRALPDDVRKYMIEQIAKGNLDQEALDRGTVVVIDKLDQERIESPTPEGLESHLLEVFGITYRKYLRDVSIYVNGKKVEGIDPLFTSPGLMLYDHDINDGKKVVADLAVKYNEMPVELKDDITGETGMVTVRVSRLLSTFPAATSKKSKRWKIMDEYSGLVVCRNGRQVDVVRNLPKEWRFKLGNDARYVRFEVDFQPVLDRYFSVTTSKQQIVLKPKVWDMLSEHIDLGSVLRGVRAEYHKESKATEVKVEEKATTDPQTPRVSEQVMKEGERFDPRPPAPRTPQQQEEDKQAWTNIVTAEAQKTGQPPAKVEGELKARVKFRPYEIKEEALPEGAFYRPVRLPDAVWVYLNTEHRFYKEVYRGPESTPRLRAAIQVMLFVLSTCEVGATDAQLQEFYKKERGLWSHRLDTHLHLLEDHLPVEAARDAKQAEQEDGEAQAEDDLRLATAAK